MAVYYYTEGVLSPRQLRKRIVKRWINHVAMSHGKRVGEIVCKFCNDEYMLEVNRSFLQHDYYTDIITFDYSKGNKVSGDLLISLDTVRSNARKFGTLYYDELHRVIIHGLLHLCGLGDKTESEAKRMRQAEEEALQLLQQLKEEVRR